MEMHPEVMRTSGATIRSIILKTILTSGSNGVVWNAISNNISGKSNEINATVKLWLRLPTKSFSFSISFVANIGAREDSNNPTINITIIIIFSDSVGILVIVIRFTNTQPILNLLVFQIIRTICDMPPLGLLLLT